MRYSYQVDGSAYLKGDLPGVHASRYSTSFSRFEPQLCVHQTFPGFIDDAAQVDARLVQFLALVSIVMAQYGLGFHHRR